MESTGFGQKRGSGVQWDPGVQEGAQWEFCGWKLAHMYVKIPPQLETHLPEFLVKRNPLDAMSGHQVFPHGC